MTLQRIQSDFLDRFACKCGACRRTCCRDWEVRLSRREFHAARSPRRGAEASTLARQNLQRNPASQSDDDHALCLLRADGSCTFLTHEALCAWKQQTNAGLCLTCDNFPNTYFRFVDTEYVFPSLACEGIVELLLTRTEPIELIHTPSPETRESYNAHIAPERFERRPLLAYYPRLIEWGLAILQNRTYDLDDRMVLLAQAMSLVDWLERSGRTAELPAAMDKFLAPETLERSLQPIMQVPIGPKAFLTVNGDTMARYLTHKVYQQQARQTLAGLGIEPVEENGSTRLLMADRERLEQRRQVMARTLQGREHLLEHLLVSEYLRSMVPVAAPSVWDHFKVFNVGYALLKGMLCGCFEAAPSDDELVESIVVLHRMFQHEYDSSPETLAYLEAIQMLDLHAMIALAKG